MKRQPSDNTIKKVSPNTPPNASQPSLCRDATSGIERVCGQAHWVQWIKFDTNANMVFYMILQPKQFDIHEDGTQSQNDDMNYSRLTLDMSNQNQYGNKATRDSMQTSYLQIPSIAKSIEQQHDQKSATQNFNNKLLIEIP